MGLACGGLHCEEMQIAAVTLDRCPPPTDYPRQNREHAMTRIAVAALLLVAVVSGASAQSPKVLRFAPNADLVVVDPHINSATTTLMHAQLIYEELFSLDSRMQPKPQMVERTTVSPDGLEYRFTLRPGLKFHDGQPVTSADVVASVGRWMVRDTLGQKMKERMVAFQADSADSFSMRFSRRFAFVESALAQAIGNQPVIMRRQDAETDPFKAVTTTIGSGPFRFLRDRWIAGASAAYERNRDYVPRAEPMDGLAGGKIVRLDRVEMVVMPDASTRASSLATGEIDLIDQLPQDLTELMQRTRNVVVSGNAPIEFEAYIRPNHLFPPFDNPKGLEALAYLVKQTDYLNLYGPKEWWRECYSFLVCGTPNGTEAGSEPYRHQDLARAKQLLAEAGYKGEKIVVIAAADNPVQKGLADVTVGALRSIGVNVDYQVIDFGTVLARRISKRPPAEGGWNLYHSALNGGGMTSPITNMVIDSACDGKNYFGWPCDATVERLRAEYLDAPDEAARRAKLEEISRALWKSFPVVLLGQYIQPYAWRTNITGLLKTFPLAFWSIDKQ
jgi:peptide/nickel transport system substrate-binding protein